MVLVNDDHGFCRNELMWFCLEIKASCRLPFSRALKEALYKVVVEPSSIGAWVQLLLLPRCTLQVVKPQNRRDRRSGNRKSLQQHHILECLATWRETNGLAKLVDRLLGSYRHGQGYGKDNIEEENHKMDTNIKQCLRKVADRHFTAAIKVLGSSGVAPYNEDTMKILGDKHLSKIKVFWIPFKQRIVHGRSIER